MFRGSTLEHKKKDSFLQFLQSTLVQTRQYLSLMGHPYVPPGLCFSGTHYTPPPPSSPGLGSLQTYTTATTACRRTANRQDFVEFSPDARSQPCHNKVLHVCGVAGGETCGKNKTGGQWPSLTPDKMADRAEISSSKMASQIDLYQKREIV